MASSTFRAVGHLTWRQILPQEAAWVITAPPLTFPSISNANWIFNDLSQGQWHSFMSLPSFPANKTFLFAKSTSYQWLPAGIFLNDEDSGFHCGLGKLQIWQEAVRLTQTTTGCLVGKKNTSLSDFSPGPDTLHSSFKLVTETWSSS